jgi:DNA-binding CsgD family transcriptional regulator
MPVDPDVLAHTLAPLVDRLDGHDRLNPDERDEVLRIARAFACKDSARATGLAPETIRGRRKRIYVKLGVRGAAEIVAALLALAAGMLARGESIPVPSPGSLPVDGDARRAVRARTRDEARDDGVE